MRKKKIKDFTIGEIHKICPNCDDCSGCPLSKTAYSLECPIARLLDKDLEQEIEVEDD